MVARHGHRELVSLLLQRHADVNAADLVHSTALHEAVGAGSLPCVKLLLDAKADLRMETLEGETAILRARRMGHEEIRIHLEEVVSAGRWETSDRNALRKLCTNGSMAAEVIRDVLFCGHPVCGSEEVGSATPLFEAAAVGNSEVTQQHGAHEICESAGCRWFGYF